MLGIKWECKDCRVFKLYNKSQGLSLHDFNLKMNLAKKAHFLIVAFALGFLLVINVPSPYSQKNPNRLTILYSNNINGEIAPFLLEDRRFVLAVWPEEEHG